jgi:hypothetical protein
LIGIRAIQTTTTRCAAASSAANAISSPGPKARFDLRMTHQYVSDLFMYQMPSSWRKQARQLGSIINETYRIDKKL